MNTTIYLAQWSLAIYMLGVALTAVIYGPLSEGIGRKSPILIGLGILIVGSIICVRSEKINTLIIGRFIQGLGAGACAALWRSIFRDMFKGEELAKYGSYIVILVTFIMPAAPILGGYFEQYASFRASFVFVMLYSIFTFAVVLFGLKETSQHHHKSRLKLSYIFKTYSKLFFSRVFMGSTLGVFFNYGALFAWITASPNLLIKEVGISPTFFGWITFLGAGPMFALAGYLNGKFVTKFSVPFMLRFGWSCVVLSSLFLFISYYAFGVTLWPITFASLILYFGLTFIWPNLFACAFTPFGKIAGYAGSAYSFMQIGGGAALGSLASFLPTKNQIPLSIVIFASSLLAWTLYETLVHKAYIEGESDSD